MEAACLSIILLVSFLVV